MPIKLQIGHTYRTRTGNGQYTIDHITTDGVAYSGPGRQWLSQSWWSDTGQKFSNSDIHPEDLVEDITQTIAGPVRQTTVTRTEIKPGVYNGVSVRPYGGENGRAVVVAFVGVPDDDHAPGYWAAMNAEELDAAATTLTQLADALRAIAAEKGTDQ